MDTREAFDAIQRAMNADPQKSVLESFYDDKAFGNFWITYVQSGQRLSVVNDRGQLILYDGPSGDHFREMLVSEIGDADERAVLAAVR